MSEFQTNDDGYIAPSDHNITAIKNKLNAIGSGFCLAKWNQITLHLGTGMIHSCHHPVPHKIPLDEIRATPLALLNTSVMKAARKEMLANRKPKECDYCWRIETNDGNSDRYLKSIEPWALPTFDRTRQLTGDEDVFPSYLEVSFGNTCNMKCTYCGPEFSSMWVEDLKEHGPVKLNEGTPFTSWANGWQDLDSLNYRNRDTNPYLDTFWEIFPEVYPHLKVYRITGGEPLLNKELFKTLDWIKANPNPDLDLAINSNLAVPDKLWNRFVDAIVYLKDNKCLKKVSVFTSVEGWGSRAEYGRTGLDFGLFQSRYEQLCALGNINAVIMATYNIFSVTSFQQLLEWHLDLKAKYNPNNAVWSTEIKTGFNLLPGDSAVARRERNPHHATVVSIDIPYLRHPAPLDVQYVDDDLVEQYMLPTLDYMSKNVTNNSWSRHQGFEEHELEKLKRIIVNRLHFKNKGQTDRHDVEIQNAAFYDFVNDMDRRNKTDFCSVFPEMIPFYERCKHAREKLRNDSASI